MIDGHWEIGNTAPVIGFGVVDLDHFRRCAASDDAAERDDLGAKGYRRVLTEGAGWDGGEDGPGLREGAGEDGEPGEEGNETHCHGDGTQMDGCDSDASLRWKPNSRK